MPNNPGQSSSSHCVFCGIVDGSQAALFFRDQLRGFVDSRAGTPSAAWSEEAANVFIFENQFLFFDHTSLVIPGDHPPSNGRRFYAQQSDLWQDLGVIGRSARDHGVQTLEWMQDRNPQRAPNGFRIFCNFGSIGEQTQPHGHLQVHAGQELDPSRFAPTGEPWTDAVETCRCQVLAETEHAIFYDASPVLRAGQGNLWQVTLSVGFSTPQRKLPKLAVLAVPKQPRSQYELWSDAGAVAAEAEQFARIHSPGGFRLLSNFPGQQAEEEFGPAHILICGGDYLGLYADYF